jgi:hypothetical protein
MVLSPERVKSASLFCVTVSLRLNGELSLTGELDSEAVPIQRTRSTCAEVS